MASRAQGYYKWIVDMGDLHHEGLEYALRDAVRSGGPMQECFGWHNYPLSCAGTMICTPRRARGACSLPRTRALAAA
jgi:hypothetical protein